MVDLWDSEAVEAESLDRYFQQTPPEDVASFSDDDEEIGSAYLEKDLRYYRRDLPPQKFRQIVKRIGDDCFTRLKDPEYV